MRSADAADSVRGPGLLLPIAIAAMLLLAGIFIWAWFHGGKPELVVRASTLQAQASNPATETAKSPALAAAPVVSPASSANSNSTNSLVPATVTAPSANAVLATDPPRPPPPAFRLQGIFFSGKNTSALINGKSVIVGGRIGDARVVAITRESATIITAAGQTNLLEVSN
jgi:hypothetical protein